MRLRGRQCFHFDYDSSSLSDDARAAIDAHVALMMADGGNVRLEGHTDERGREYNLALGERRANVVRDYMVASGVPATELKQSATVKKIQLLTARVSLAGARTAAWRSSKAL